MIIKTKTLIPLKENERLYKHYNLLNNESKIKEVIPSIKIRKWIKTLNLSPYYHFELRLCNDGKWRIFIYNISCMSITKIRNNDNNSKKPVKLEYLLITYTL